MATILDDLKKKKTIKYGKIQIKLPEELKEKIEFITKHNDIDRSDYLCTILEKSEINKVYNATKKSIEEQEIKDSSSDDTSSSSDISDVNNA